MTPADDESRDLPADSNAAADERYWRSFALAAGFVDELADADAIDDGHPDAASLLAADRLHELLAAARPKRSKWRRAAL